MLVTVDKCCQDQQEAAFNKNQGLLRQSEAVDLCHLHRRALWMSLVQGEDMQ